MFYFQGVVSQAPNEFINYKLCEKFNWTYQELMSQPVSFIESILRIMEIENKLKNAKY